MEWEIDRRIGAASAWMQTLKQSIVKKRKLSQKAKLSTYRSIYVQALTDGHELWLVTERNDIEKYKWPERASSAGGLGSALEIG